MKLEGSCQCGDVKFSVETNYPHPFNLCYCSICRKAAGSGGYAINLSARFETLQIEGTDNIRRFSAATVDPETGKTERSQAQRSFCGTCGSALWLWDPRWPELLHPLASVIDTELPTPPERTHLMLGSKASWVEPDIRSGDKAFQNYPDESIAAWHERLGLRVD